MNPTRPRPPKILIFSGYERDSRGPSSGDSLSGCESAPPKRPQQMKEYEAPILFLLLFRVLIGADVDVLVLDWWQSKRQSHSATMFRQKPPFQIGRAHV